MQELNMVEVEEVSGGIWNFVVSYFAAKAIDKTYDAVVEGKVDYSSTANQAYCATGA